MGSDTSPDPGRPDEAAAPPPAHNEAAAPPTHNEALVRDLWAELLGMEDPPLNVSFFELGGYSQAVLTLAAKLQDVLGMPVPVADLFENPTIRQQAELLERLYEEWLSALSR